MAIWKIQLIISFIAILCKFGAFTIQNCDSPPAIRDGNYSQTAGNAVVYTCAESYQMRGQSTLQCINSTWVPRSPPTCRRQPCPSVPVFAKSSKNFYGTAYPGQVVEYNCHHGYTISGPVYRSTCQSNLTWSATNFTCNVVSCGQPPVLSGGRLVTVTNTNYLGKATYRCSDGYKMRAASSYRPSELITLDVNCWATGWANMPTCVPVSCGDSPTVEHASKRVQGSNLYMDSAFYECAPGYTILGNSTIQCKSDGKWSPPPSCQIKSCPRPEKIPHASIVSMNGDNSFGGQIMYQCKTGFESKSSPIIVCKPDQTWTASPECIPRDCGIPPAIHFGSYQLQNTTFGSNTTYKCEPNFNLVGYDVIRCGANGLWDEAPLCVRSGKGQGIPSANNQTSGYSSQYPQMMYILAIIFAVLAILLIVLIIVIVRVYGVFSSSTLCCIPGSGILTKPGSPATKDNMDNRLDGNEHGF